MKKTELIKPLCLLLTGFILTVGSLIAQENIGEAGISDYTLPDPLVTLDGRAVTTPDMWSNVRRPEVLELLETELFGIAPGPPKKMESRILSTHTSGKVTYKQVQIDLTQGENTVSFNVLICFPRNAKGPVPVFLGMNFMGNHTVTSDPSIIIPQKSMRNGGNNGTSEDLSPEEPRGSFASRWPVESVVGRGYGIVTLSRVGGQKLFQKEREPGDWGSLSSWAWILRRVIDYLETDDAVDQNRIAVIGTSRLGKTALWAGAMDERIAMVIPMCTGGCGGASLMSMRFFGEDSDAMNCGIGPGKLSGNFQKYLDKEAVLPFDQHMLISLIAPRPIYVGTAEGQKEPQNLGMYLALKHAEPVYKLLGTDGFGADSMPDLHQPVQTTMGFHIRSGKHGIEEYDWNCFMDFADKHLPGKE